MHNHLIGPPFSKAVWSRTNIPAWRVVQKMFDEAFRAEVEKIPFVRSLRAHQEQDLNHG